MPSKLNYLFLNQTTNKHLISHLINFQFYDFSLAQSKMNTNSNKKNQSFPEASSPPKVGTENWGTHIMGTPAVPSSHPDNKKAALQSGQPQPVQYYHDQHHHPYVQHSTLDKPSNSPMESILNMFDSWSRKAEATAHNVWHNRESS